MSTDDVYQGDNHGAYPCCGAPAVRFDSSGLRQMGRGCCAADHKVDMSAKGGGDGPDFDSAAILAMLSKVGCLREFVPALSRDVSTVSGRRRCVHLSFLVCMMVLPPFDGPAWFSIPSESFRPPG